MATRRVWYTLSAVMMIVCFGSFAMRGLNFAIDFTGGIGIEATFSKPADVEKIRETVIAANYHDPVVTTLQTVRDVQIRLSPTGETSDKLRPKFEALLKMLDPAVQITQLAVVGPQVGDELRNSA